MTKLKNQNMFMKKNNFKSHSSLNILTKKVEIISNTTESQFGLLIMLVSHNDTK